MSNPDWEPVAAAALLARVAQGEARMNQAQLRLWKVNQIKPEKWQQHPCGDLGGGFWVVGLVCQPSFGSRYSVHGVIEDYWCNDDELELTVQSLLNTLELDADLIGLPTGSLLWSVGEQAAKRVGLGAART